MDRPNFKTYADQFEYSDAYTLEELLTEMFNMGVRYHEEQWIREIDMNRLEQLRLQELLKDLDYDDNKEEK